MQNPPPDAARQRSLPLRRVGNNHHEPPLAPAVRHARASSRPDLWVGGALWGWAHPRQKNCLSSPFLLRASPAQAFDFSSRARGASAAHSTNTLLAFPSCTHTHIWADHQQMLKWRKFMRDQNHNPNPSAAPRAPKLDPNSTPITRASTRRSFPSASIPPAIPRISNRHFAQLEIGGNFMKTKRK